MLAIEIALLVLLSVIWAVCLYRKGKQLKARGNPNKDLDTRAESSDRKSDREMKNLLKKAQEFYKAKLSYDKDEIEEKENALRDHLVNEYERMQREDAKDTRQLMVMKIRRALIQNPYDQIGRSMASETKKVFLQQVLKEKSWIPKLKGPLCFKRGKKILLMIPVMLAVWGTMQKGFFYLYGIYTDVEVIRELKSIPNITMPKIPPVKIEKFLLKDIKEKGMPGLRKPCEALDVLEEIPNHVIPFYKQTVGDIANVHWNPARNSTFHLSEAFKLTQRLSEIYIDTMKFVKQFGSTPSKPSSVVNLVRNMSYKLSEIEEQLNDVNSGWKGWMVNMLSEVDPNHHLPIIRKGIEVLDTLEKDILDSDLVRHVLKKGDHVFENRLYSETTYSEMIHIFSKEIYDNIRPEVMSASHVFNDTHDPYVKDLNADQIKCRKFARQLFQLAENDDIERWVVHSFTSKKSESKADGVANNVNAKTKFLTQNIIRSVFYFLVLNLAWTILIELRCTFMDFWQSNHLPLITNFDLICQENDPNSMLLNSGGNSSNEYVVKSSQRHSINILEATHETVSAINVQIALWIYMSTYIADTRRVFKDTFNIDVTSSMFNLDDNTFTDFNSSAMMTSLVAGIFSLTFAQYKQYMTRHAKDAEILGKIVYFLACVFNSFAIFLSQIVYFTIGLPYLICILIYVIRMIVNFDKYDQIPNSVPSIIIFLVLTLVLLPLKFFPIKVAEIIKILTDRFFLHKKYHMNERNRSGYDVPGFKMALFMFLPSSHNNLSHVNNKESFVNPGFYYFSKDPLSKELYRLRFEVQMFCKVLMHTFYLGVSFFFLNTLHLLLLSSTVLSNDHWVSKLHDQDSWQTMIGNFFSSVQILILVKKILIFHPPVSALTLMLPFLILSFALLYVYYKHCHPWLKEGVSVGFEPLDQEMWNFSTRSKTGEKRQLVP